MKGLSLIICCYNSTPTIRETLKHIQNQETRESDHWEVILVNNNSSDNTAEVALASWDFDKGNQLRIVDEPEPGLSFARIKGVKEAKYDVISYVDDDNLLPKNWISYMLDAFSNPEIGVLGCTSIGKFDIEEPDWYANDQHKFAFATGILYKKSDFQNVTENGLLFGAGLTMRKEIFDTLWASNWKPLLSGRKGDSQSGGEDSELTLASRLLGYKLFYTNELQITHWIINNRLSWDRLKKVTKGFGEADVFLIPYNYAYKKINNELSFGFKLRKLWWVNYIGKKVALLKWNIKALLGKISKDDLEIIEIRLNSFCKTIYKEKLSFRQSFNKVNQLANKNVDS